MTEERFNVVQFFPDGTSEYVARGVGAKEAVETARSYTTGPAALIGIVQRVIITDGGDHTNFEWVFGKGVVFPPEARPDSPTWVKPKHEGAGDPVRIVQLRRGDELGDVRIQHYGDWVRVATFLPGRTIDLPGDTPKTEPENYAIYHVPARVDDANRCFDGYVETATQDGWRKVD